MSRGRAPYHQAVGPAVEQQGLRDLHRGTVVQEDLTLAGDEIEQLQPIQAQAALEPEGMGHVPVDQPPVGPHGIAASHRRKVVCAVQGVLFFRIDRLGEGGVYGIKRCRPVHGGQEIVALQLQRGFLLQTDRLGVRGVGLVLVEQR